ncbi:glucose-induced degradation complex subunit VID24 [Saccharomyces eubayanus]|uniref:glucose-induced degradation complex subunit VID24 n=1 Tax=Saccharomyces eubayanus TaxID=1080349 RepID=UPI0006C346DB|nr:VID24-like protein [Saccharomyces eubayanus]KOH00425.1 VID24-like protein [Saccharomyces eubayanus]
MINNPKVDSLAEKSKATVSKHPEQVALPELAPAKPAPRQQYPITFNLTSNSPFRLVDRQHYLQDQDLYKCASRDSLSSLQQLAHTANGSIRKKYIVEDQSPYWPEDPVAAIPSLNHTTCTNYLRPRMQFTGYQISGYKRYQVTVNLKTVDFPTGRSTSLSPHLSGFLSIRGLTNQHPEISTYFEAYAVTHKELAFLSSSWKDEPVLNEYKATDQTDLEHWINFPSFRQLFLMSQKNTANPTDSNTAENTGKNQQQQQLPTTSSTDANNISRIFSQEKQFGDYLDERFIFMKWKEKFLVPDALLMEGVDGASYDGFYYIVHDQVTGNIQGFYYHQDAEKFQQLELVPSMKNKVESSDCSFEFA